MEINLTSRVERDEYTSYVEDKFDLGIEEASIVSIPFNLRVDMNGDWNIGVICGASGSGKSTILSRLGEIKEPTFDDNAIISNLKPLDPQEASSLLCAIGLASVPTWLRPYKSLSNGEKYRASLAKLLASNQGEIILIDEYTSVVDRNTAKAMSNALAKYVRAKNIKVILASCHYDILEWLKPNWIYDLNKGGVLERGDYLQRPPITLSIYRTTTHTWTIFEKHHYLTQELNQSAWCFCFT